MSTGGSVAIPVRSPATAAKSSAIDRASPACTGLTVNDATGICSHLPYAMPDQTHRMVARSCGGAWLATLRERLTRMYVSTLQGEVVRICMPK
jgi:hypothetical protein